MNVRQLPAATADAADAGVGLELLRPGWGGDFEALMLMRQAVASITAHPQLYPRTHDGPDEPENRE